MNTIISIILSGTMLLSVHLHPGRTDAQGGHWNRSTGEYHWHHGYPEHQHTDMDGDGVLDCPYDFKEKKSSSSSSSSSRPASGVTITPTKPASSSSGLTPIAKVSNVKNEEDNDPTVFLLSAAGIFVYLVSFFIQKSRISDRDSVIAKLQGDISGLNLKMKAESEANKNLAKKAENTFKNELKAQKEKMISGMDEQRKSILTLFESLDDTFGKEWMLKTSGAPEGAYVDDDGFPHLSFPDSQKYNEYVLYVSKSGKFHDTKCQHWKGCRTISALYVPEKQFNENKCLLCNPKYPDLAWYYKYRQLHKLAEEYDQYSSP